jgi:hypothetical protein
VVGKAVRVTVGAATAAAAVLTSVPEVDCALMEGFAAAAVALPVAVALPAAVDPELSPQAARANSAVHPITQCAKRGASLAIKPAWPLVNFIENLLGSAPVSCTANPKRVAGQRPQSRRVVV